MKKFRTAIVILSLSMLFYSCGEDKMKDGPSDEFLQEILNEAENNE